VSVQAQFVGEVSADKPWSVSAKVRGFYDDNYATLPATRTDGGPTKRASYGVSISPSASFTVGDPVSGPTYLRLGYDYDLRWFEDRKKNSADHSHVFDLRLNHRFSDRYRIELGNNFVIAQEPSLLNPSTAVQGSYIRTDGNNVRNRANVAFDAALTEKLGTRLAYANTLYDYEQTGAGSRSALLDRIEHLGTADLRWMVQPTTTALVGYSFGLVDQTSKDLLLNPIGSDGLPLIKDPTTGARLTAADMAAIPTAEVRNSQSHYGFVGVDHSFTTALNTQVRVGAQYTTYPDALPGVEDNTWNPYVDASLSYQYSQDSRALLGVKHQRNQTDFGMYRLGVVEATLDQESTLLYVGIVHRLLPKLYGLVRGSWQGSEFNQGAFDTATDNYYMADVNLTYEISRWIAAEAGYLYDKLDSDIPNRGFDRHRVYVGVRATY